MRLWATALAAALLLAGCGRTDGREQKGASGQPPLAIGLLPEAHIFRQLDRYEPVAAYLARKAKIPIGLRIVPRYGNVIRTFQEGALDGAFFGSFTYVLAHSKLGVEILARPVAANGASTYHGLMIARADSGIRGVKGMKGKTLVLVDRATMAGYLFPLAYFKKSGIPSYRGYFRETYFAGTQEDVVLDVLSRKADVGAVKNTVFDRMAARDDGIRSKLMVLAQSPDVPENGLAVRKTLSPELKERLKEALLTMHKDPEGLRALGSIGAVRFLETADRDYDPVLKFVGDLDLDLATYDHEND